MSTKADVTKLITDFRAIVGQNAISPESLGYILQQILNVSPEQSDSQEDLECVCVNKYAEFARTLSEDMEPKLETQGALQEGNVVFCPKYGTFIYEAGANAIQKSYYDVWPEWTKYGSEQGLNGILPEEGRLYCDKSADTLYRWDGSNMVAVGKASSSGDGSVSPGSEIKAGGKVLTGIRIDIGSDFSTMHQDNIDLETGEKGTSTDKFVDQASDSTCGLMSADDYTRLHRLSLFKFDYFFESEDELSQSESAFEKGDIAYIGGGANGVFTEFNGTVWGTMPYGDYNAQVGISRCTHPHNLFLCDGKIYRTVVRPQTGQYYRSHLELAFLGANELDEVNLNFSTLQQSVTGWLATKEDKVRIQQVQASDNLSLIPSTYYVVSGKIEGEHTYALNRDVGADMIQTISMYFETGENPQIHFWPTAGESFEYFEGFSLQPNTKYELNLRFNGEVWIVSSSTIN